MVEAGVNGELAEPGDATAWTAIFQRLLGDPEILARWKRGAQKAREAGGPDVYAPRMVDVFERMAALTQTPQPARATA
jgi:hypothetical protein